MKRKLLIISLTVLLIFVGLSGCEERIQNGRQDTNTGFEWFQIGNIQAMSQIQPKRSSELEDNHIGKQIELSHIGSESNRLCNFGYKWLRVEIDKYGDWWDVDWSKDKYSIDSEVDNAVTDLANNGINMIACLGAHADNIGKHEDYGRFKTEEETQIYLDYLRFIVRHFKDRIKNYEIWNEPDVWLPDWYIELPDYINLINRSIQVIHEEYPEAKVVVGGTSELRIPESRDYLFNVLKSDIISMVDVVSWHPMYGASPEYDEYKQYYYEYPSIVQEIKDTAYTNGFKGVYIADELNWIAHGSDGEAIHAGERPIYNEFVAAKYYARGIMIHRGMNITANIIDWGGDLSDHVIRNLSTIIAGAKPTNHTIEIQSNATNIRNYTFSLSNSDMLVALWTDSVAVDNDTGVRANLTIQNIVSENVTGIDVLYGYQQSIIMSNENGNLIIQNLIVRDYPMILHIVKFA